MLLVASLGLLCGLGAALLARPYLLGPPGWLVAAMAVSCGALFALVVWRFGVTWEAPAYLYFAALSVVLAAIDVATQRLPNRFTLSAYPILLALLALPAAISGMWPAYLRAVVGGLVLLAVFMTLRLVYPAGMGLGDVKLAGPVGLATGWVSWTAPLWAIFVGFLVAAAVSIVLLALRRTTRKSEIAFGPSMLLGAWTVLVASGQFAT